MMILVHSSKDNLNKAKKIRQEDVSSKPNGYYYTIQPSYGDHYDMYNYEITVKYTSIDKPDKNKVLKLKELDDLDRFTFQYGEQDGIVKINWVSVAEDFGGIEIDYIYKQRQGEVADIKYHKKFADKPIKLWFDVWDQKGGYIWNPKAITKMKPIIMYKQAWDQVKKDLNTQSLTSAYDYLKRDDHPEIDHMMEDYIMKKFIKGIAKDKYNKDDAKGMAKIITKINKLKVTRWFA